MVNSAMPSNDGANELIPLTEIEGIQAVMGRDLYDFLEVDTEYRHWFPRMVEYGFIAGQDYTVKNDRVQDSLGRERERTNHVLTLDMAKEISMIQRTDKGKQARQYFIECERRAHAPKIDGTELTRRIISNERAGKAAATPSLRGRTESLRGGYGSAPEATPSSVSTGILDSDQEPGDSASSGLVRVPGEQGSQRSSVKLAKVASDAIGLVHNNIRSSSGAGTPWSVTEHIGGVQ